MSSISETLILQWLVCSLCKYKHRGFWVNNGEICPNCKKGVIKTEVKIKDQT